MSDEQTTTTTAPDGTEVKTERPPPEQGEQASDTDTDDKQD